MRILFLLLFSISTLFSSEREKLLNVVAGQWIAHGVYTATKLDIASHLYEGSKSVEHLARVTNSDEEHLYRLLRLLASEGIFKEEPGRKFSNSKASKLLSEKHPESLRYLILFYSDEMSPAFAKLPQCVQKGIPAFELTYQKPVFSYFEKNGESASLFNTAMREKSKLVINSCIEAYNFKKFSTIYDIGGGTGHFLYTLMNKYPHMRGLLFETPSVAKEARAKLKAFEKRCGIVSGDFFKNVPADGQAYLLKSVIHDWDDVSALKILKKCHSAMREDAKLVIIEPLISPKKGRDYAKAVDLLMMTITGGQERSEADFRYLLRQGGFSIDSITKTDTEFVVIQASKI